MEPTLTNAQLREVMKALGFGNITTDVAQLTQGGALIPQSLDRVVKELNHTDKSFPLLDSLQPERVGNEMFEWVDRTNKGTSEYQTVSDRSAGAVETQSTFNRRTHYVKYFAVGYGTLDTLTELADAFPEVGQEQVVAVTNIKIDQSRLIWEGDQDVSPNQMSGFSWWVRNYSNTDGEHIADLGSPGFSGLDANGFSNPADVEKATRLLATTLSNPKFGRAHITDLFMSPSSGTDMDRYTGNFTGFVTYDGDVNERFTGLILGGFANRFNPTRKTLLNIDQYIRDADALKPQTTRPQTQPLTSTMTPTFGVATSVATATEGSRFTAAWNGNYVYLVCGVDARGVESLPAAITGVAINNATANKATLTITASTGGETGYAIYRSFPGAANDPNNVRLVKRIARNVSGTTVFVDLNKDYPGATEMYGWNKNQPGFLQTKYTVQYRTIELPRSLAALAKRPYGAFTSMGLTIPYYTHATMIKNYVPAAGGWSPLAGNV